MEVYKTLLVIFDIEFIKAEYKNQKPNMISQSEAPAQKEIVAHKQQRYISSVISYFSSSTGELGLTGVIRVLVTPQKHIPKKKKYIKPKDLSPFITGNKILLNEDNDNNPETIDTSLYGKMIYHILVQMILLKKNENKLQIMMTNKRRKL